MDRCTILIKGIDLNYPHGGAQYREDRRFHISLTGTQHAIDALETKITAYLSTRKLAQ